MGARAFGLLMLIAAASLVPILFLGGGDAVAAHPGGTGEGEGIAVDYSSAPEALLHLSFATAPPEVVRVTIVSDDDVQSISPLPAQRELFIRVVPLDYGEHSILVTLSTSGARFTECSLVVTEYCTVAFSAGEGSGSMDAAEVAFGKEYRLPECSFTAPDGMEFHSWMLNGAEVPAGDTAVIDRDCEAIAVWSEASPSKDGGFPLWIAVASIIVVLAAISAFFVLRGRTR